MIKYCLALLFAGLVFGEVRGGGAAGRTLGELPAAASRITGGEKANLKDLPYQLFTEARINGVKYSCGAIIYNSRWALTAAHCVVRYQRNLGLVTLHAGYYNKSSPNSTGAEQKFKVSEIHVHDKYKRVGLGYDVALLRIPKKFKFSKFVKAVKLSKGGDLTNKTAVVSGWGSTHFSGHSYPDVLLKAEVKIISGKDCRKAWRSFNESIQICTKSAPIKKGPCRGDSGGPLVVRREQVHELVGIASYVERGECNLRRPAVYTKVSYFIPWIKRIVKLLPTFVIS